MNLKYFVASASFSVLVFSSGLALSQEDIAPNQDSHARRISYQREIDEARAPIKSESDLRKYLLTESLSSPLNRLSPDAKARFISSLIFSEKGLGSYNYQSLEDELTASQIYDVLSLFGAQATTHLISGAKVESKADLLIMQPQVISLPCEEGGDLPCHGGGGDTGSGGGEVDHFEYSCGSPHTCISTPGAICMHTC
ncbi:hypothetical protein [Luteibacter sp. CQ10]|uniref:hypothetical protein n=1 Tax=Luteibacter sp. CQ10 TaxID=2805821 RepID=UPI0034A3D7D8